MRKNESQREIQKTIKEWRERKKDGDREREKEKI